MINYYMRAYHTVLTQYVYWTSPGAPDMTGTSSGYTPGDLAGIVVDNQIAGNAQIVNELAQDQDVKGSAGTLAIPSAKGFDASVYASYTITFVAIIYSNNASYSASASLYNTTDSELVTGASVNTTSLSPVLLESSALTVGSSSGNLKDSEKLYEVRLQTAGTTGAIRAYLHQSYLRAY